MAIKAETIKQGSKTYVCFEGKLGHKWFFEKAKMRRGRPGRGPYTCVEDIPRPANMLTLKEAGQICGHSKQGLLRRIWNKELPAVKKLWSQGVIRRRYWLVDIGHLKDMMAKEAIQKYTGDKVIWDQNVRAVLGEEGE